MSDPLEKFMKSYMEITNPDSAMQLMNFLLSEKFHHKIVSDAIVLSRRNQLEWVEAIKIVVEKNNLKFNEPSLLSMYRHLLDSKLQDDQILFFIDRKVNLSKLKKKKGICFLKLDLAKKIKNTNLRQETALELIIKTSEFSKDYATQKKLSQYWKDVDGNLDDIKPYLPMAFDTGPSVSLEEKTFYCVFIDHEKSAYENGIMKDRHVWFLNMFTLHCENKKEKFFYQKNISNKIHSEIYFFEQSQSQKFLTKFEFFLNLMKADIINSNLNSYSIQEKFEEIWKKFDDFYSLNQKLPVNSGNKPNVKL